MAFRLENWGVTYKECVHVILESQIGRNVEAYIDDIVVKSKKQGHLLDDLKETFDNIHKYKMMLNPKKCVLVCHQGNCSAIWSCPEEFMQTRRRWYPSNNCNHLETEKIQKLADMMALLNRFISKLGERGMPFYKLLCKADGFQWDD
jgi:hypothetical protein